MSSVAHTAQRLSLRLHGVAGRAAPDRHALIAMFHRFIQQRLLPERLLDVADYGHVAAGPGVLLVSHEAYISVELGAGPWGASGGAYGLRIKRRRPEEGSLSERLAAGFKTLARTAQAVGAAAELGSPLAFETGLFELGFDDRLAAPASAETTAALLPQLQSLLEPLVGAPVQCTEAFEPGGPFRLRVDCATAPADWPRRLAQA